MINIQYITAPHLEGKSVGAKTQGIPWNRLTCDLTEPMRNYDLKYTWREWNLLEKPLT